MMKLCECIRMCQDNYHNGSWIHSPPTKAHMRDPLRQLPEAQKINDRDIINI